MRKRKRSDNPVTINNLIDEYLDNGQPEVKTQLQKLLKENEGIVNAQDDKGNTPLTHLIADRLKLGQRHLTLFQILLKAKANVNVPNSSGYSSLGFLVCRYLYELHNHDEYNMSYTHENIKITFEIFKGLLNKGASLDYKIYPVFPQTWSIPAKFRPDIFRVITLIDNPYIIIFLGNFFISKIWEKKLMELVKPVLLGHLPNALTDIIIAYAQDDQQAYFDKITDAMTKHICNLPPDADDGLPESAMEKCTAKTDLEKAIASLDIESIEQLVARSSENELIFRDEKLSPIDHALPIYHEGTNRYKCAIVATSLTEKLYGMFRLLSKPSSQQTVGATQAMAMPRAAP